MTRAIINGPNLNAPLLPVRAPRPQPPQKIKTFGREINLLITEALACNRVDKEARKSTRKTLLKYVVKNKVPLIKLKERITYIDSLVYAHEPLEVEGVVIQSRSQRLNAFIDNNFKSYHKSMRKTMIITIAFLVTSLAMVALGIVALNVGFLAAEPALMLLQGGALIAFICMITLFDSRTKKYEVGRTAVQIEQEKKDLIERSNARFAAFSSPIAKVQAQKIETLEKQQQEILTLLKEIKSQTSVANLTNLAESKQ